MTTTDTTNASGWVLFATTMFALVGVFNIFFGLTLIIDNEWLVLSAGELWYLDTAAWGWITLVIGVLALIVAWGVLSGQTWAQVVGLIMAGLAVLDSFVLVAIYPLWGIIVLVLSVLVIYALAVHGDEVS